MEIISTFIVVYVQSVSGLMSTDWLPAQLKCDNCVKFGLRTMYQNKANKNGNQDRTHIYSRTLLFQTLLFQTSEMRTSCFIGCFAQVQITFPLTGVHYSHRNVSNPLFHTADRFFGPKIHCLSRKVVSHH